MSGQPEGRKIRFGPVTRWIPASSGDHKTPDGQTIRSWGKDPETGRLVAVRLDSGEVRKVNQ